jgi:hypothetical protein
MWSHLLHGNKIYGVALVLDLIANINIHDVVLENTTTTHGHRQQERHNYCLTQAVLHPKEGFSSDLRQYNVPH